LHEKVEKTKEKKERGHGRNEKDIENMGMCMPCPKP